MAKMSIERIPIGGFEIIVHRRTNISAEKSVIITDSSHKQRLLRQIENIILKTVTEKEYSRCIITWWGLYERGSMDCVKKGDRVIYETFPRRAFRKVLGHDPLALIIRTFHKNPDPTIHIPIKYIYIFCIKNGTMTKGTAEDYGEHGEDEIFP